MNSKYEYEDLENLSVDELCKKYGSSKQAVVKAKYRLGIRKRKAIKIMSPYKEPVIVADKHKCAEELRVSVSTIERALKGLGVPTLDDLNIKIEYVEEN